MVGKVMNCLVGIIKDFVGPAWEPCTRGHSQYKYGRRLLTILPTVPAVDGLWFSVTSPSVDSGIQYISRASCASHISMTMQYCIRT